MKRAALLLLASCRTWDGTWDVQDPDHVATDAFRSEIALGLEAIRAQEGVLHREWGGTVTVHAAPFACPDGRGLCSGWGEDHAIDVAYAPALGLGPEIGSTALEWEGCNAARSIRSQPCYLGACDGSDSASVARCAASVVPRVKELLP